MDLCDARDGLLTLRRGTRLDIASECLVHDPLQAYCSLTKSNGGNKANLNFVQDERR